VAEIDPEVQARGTAGPHQHVVESCQLRTAERQRAQHRADLPGGRYPSGADDRLTVREFWLVPVVLRMGTPHGIRVPLLTSCHGHLHTLPRIPHGGGGRLRRHARPPDTPSTAPGDTSTHRRNGSGAAARNWCAASAAPTRP